MSDLYDADPLIWSEHQVKLLEQVARGERPNEVPDWPNIIEEIGDVGRSLIAAVESLLVQALVHDMKAEGWPQARDVETWRADARRFRDDARRRFAPSMRQRIDMAAIERQAFRALPKQMDGVPPVPAALSRTIPATIDALLTEDDD
jgi:hypothetical protein